MLSHTLKFSVGTSLSQLCVCVCVCLWHTDALMRGCIPCVGMQGSASTHTAAYWAKCRCVLSCLRHTTMSPCVIHVNLAVGVTMPPELFMDELEQEITVREVSQGEPHYAKCRSPWAWRKGRGGEQHMCDVCERLGRSVNF